MNQNLSTGDGETSPAISLTRLWMEAQPSVLAFICAAIPRFSDAEDVLQETAIEAAEHFEKYDPARPFVAWAIGIAKFKISAYYRQKPPAVGELSAAVLDRVGQAQEKLHDQLDQRREALEHCLDKLPGAARKLLDLRYSEELSTDQLAERAGLSAGSVRVKLTRIRTQLLDCIQKKLSPQTRGSA